MKDYPDFDRMRRRMIGEQLLARGISDVMVLSAFENVPRHAFVGDEFLKTSYGDHPLPIGNDQTISQPYMVALMTQCLGLRGGERMLEIGTGSGYQSAILSRIAKEVFSIERMPELAAGARKRLASLGYSNCSVTVGDGTLGLPEFAPYDGIIVTAGAPDIPKALVSQLKEGGRFVIPVGSEYSQVLTVVEKCGESIKKREVCECVFVPLVGKDGWAK